MIIDAEKIDNRFKERYCWPQIREDLRDVFVVPLIKGEILSSVSCEDDSLVEVLKVPGQVAA